MEALIALLIGMTSMLGFAALGVGVFVLDTGHGGARSRRAPQSSDQEWSEKV